MFVIQISFKYFTKPKHKAFFLVYSCVVVLSPQVRVFHHSTFIQVFYKILNQLFYLFFITKSMKPGRTLPKWSAYITEFHPSISQNSNSNSLRGHPSRTSGSPGRGGVLENRTSIVIFKGILLLNPDTRGRGGLKIKIFAGRP